MMKQIITILVLIFSGLNSNAQRENILISRTDNILFVGFDNLIVVGFKDSIVPNLTVECEGCDYEIIHDKSRGYIIPVSKEGQINILLYSGEKLLQTKKFIAVFPPEPNIFVNDSIPIEQMSDFGSYFSLKMPNYTAINPQYHISSWKIEVGKITFTGEAKNISPELIKYIGRLKKPTPAKIRIEFTFGRKQFVEREFVLNN